MMGPAQRLEANVPDVYASFGHTAAQARRWRRWATGFGALLGLQAVALSFLALRPPFVIVHDRADGRPPEVRRLQLGTTPDARDARLFFTQMATLRFGWQSGSVRRDLETFLSQCHPAHRKAQLRHLLHRPGDAEATSPGRGRQSGAARAPAEASRLDAWQHEGVVNQLVLPEHWEEVHCRVRPEEPVWDCAMQARLVTTVPGHEDGRDAPGVAELQGTFVASLLEVPHTPKTPYGLLVAHLDLVSSATDAPLRRGDTP